MPNSFNHLGYLMNTIKEENFTPSLNGKTAYSGWLPRLIYRIIYYCTDDLGGYQLKKNNTEKVLNLIHQTFLLEIKEIESSLRDYELSAQSGCFKVETQKKLLAWKFHIIRFVATPPPLLEEAWEKNKILFDSVKAACNLIHLTNCQLQKLPYNGLCNLLENNELSTKEIQEIATWIDELNQTRPHNSISSKRQLSVHRVHRGLHAFVQLRYPQSSLQEKTLLLASLEEKLCHRQFNETYLDIFKTHDPKLKRWRLGIEISKQLSMDMIIKDRLSPDTGDEDRHHIYTIKDKPNHVVMINRHCAAAGIEEMQIKNYGKTADQYLDCKYIDPAGRFKIMEKGGPSIGKIPWKSTQRTLEQDDLNYLNPFCKHMIPLLKKNKQYNRLNPSYFVFHKNKWKHYIYMSKKPFNYLEIEAFFWKISQNNRWVYQYLIEACALNQREEARRLQKVAINYLQDKEIQIEENNEKLKLIEKKMIQDLDETVNRLVEQKKQEQNHLDVMNIQKSVKGQLLKWVKNTPFTGRIRGCI